MYLAPEIYVSGMFERSNPKCVGYSYPVDAWACGVIMFTLLIGKHTPSYLVHFIVTVIAYIFKMKLQKGNCNKGHV